jgi:hypothetical protein
MANQAENAPPVDQSIGSERYMVHARGESVNVAPVSAPQFAFISALASGATLGAAMDSAGLDESGLLAALRFTFAGQLVVDITPRSGS